MRKKKSMWEREKVSLYWELQNEAELCFYLREIKMELPLNKMY